MALKKEINPTVAAIVIVVIVLVIGIVGYQKATARKVESWDTMSQDVKDKIGAAYGVRPTGPQGGPQNTQAPR